MNPRGTRTAEQVARRALGALAGSGPDVIEGRLNAVIGHLVDALPARLGVPLAGWLLARFG